ncbi:MAG: cupin domain-containing protein [Desulfovibrio sp.]|uniref:cupin domain-containing protein n=1 Tax=Desulfovibrio sp. 7SRBS1 TaxID=3378064 RepID=UPI003B3FB0A0
MSEEKQLKNIPHAEVVALKDLVEYQKGQIVSRTLAQHPNVTLTLFSFDVGEGISSHSAPGDAMIQILDGTARVTIGNSQFDLQTDQSIVMPAGIPHAVEATDKFKMLLTLVKA